MTRLLLEGRHPWEHLQLPLLAFPHLQVHLCLGPETPTVRLTQFTPERRRDEEIEIHNSEWLE